MTTLTSLVDVLGALAVGPLPQPPGQGTAPGTPWWALGGALIGGGIAVLAAWLSAKQLRQSAKEALDHERVRLLNERFATAASLLGHEEPACRLAGVHAMAGLADDWDKRRQTCIDVLCAYLRMPYPAEPAETAPSEERLTWQADREVRHTVIRIIRDHLQEEVTGFGTSWEGHDFDFSGAVFDGGNFTGARFAKGKVSFVRAHFTGGQVSFDDAHFSGGEVSFERAHFTGGQVSFDDAHFSGGEVSFERAHFTGGRVFFRSARFTGATVMFSCASFAGGEVWFSEGRFARGEVSFEGADFTGAEVRFFHARFTGASVFFGTDAANSDRPHVLTTLYRGELFFDDAHFTDGEVSFAETRFNGTRVSFAGVHFTGASVSFRKAVFTGKERVYFDRARFINSDISFAGVSFSGGVVDFRSNAAWTHRPTFDAGVLDAPPAGLLLPILRDRE
ncbi:hypothetical protein GCM10022403_033820 [Streptomyces coacervatus]|uniref:Pentapeptide repeat-containing protein n=1 Tax=Streptomyces coacervatus TaxID=647381 RepID=A0ABP7HQL3_9ACTN|nr:pentapeptide repeat-containing protein [Streptomyces coacervatus]MDF2272137.1 pentapeptide repeat-containing protein [Streptomyces coacervatus]